MNKPAKQKLCWNCEGSVAAHIENCPYCGVYLSPDQVDDKHSSLSQIQAPYPFYTSKEDKTVPKALYTPVEAEKKEEVAKIEEPKKPVRMDVLEAMIPLISLTAGVVFLLFAAALYLFSTDGWLTLQWNASYWYLYIAIAFPCLFIGWKTLYRIKEEVAPEILSSE